MVGSEGEKGVGREKKNKLRSFGRILWLLASIPVAGGVGGERRWW